MITIMLLTRVTVNDDLKNTSKESGFTQSSEHITNKVAHGDERTLTKLTN